MKQLRQPLLIVLGSLIVFALAGCETKDAGRDDATSAADARVHLAGDSLTTLPNGLQLPLEIFPPAMLLSEIDRTLGPVGVLNCRIPVSNPTPEAQTITYQKSGCTCYGLSLDGRKLEEGESLSIPPRGSIELELNGMPPDSAMEKEYSVQLGVPSKGGTKLDSVPVRCIVRVEADLTVSPNVVAFHLSPGEELHETRSVEIDHVFRAGEGKSDRPRLMIEQKTVPEFLSDTRLEEMGETEDRGDGFLRQKSRLTFRVDFRAAEIEDTLRRTMLLAVTHPNGERLSRPLQFTAQLVRPIAFPSKIHFGRLTSGGGRTRRILISSTQGNPFALAPVESSIPDGVSVSVDEGRSPRHWVTLGVAPDAVGNWEASVILRTDHPDQPEIRLQLEALISAPEAD